jgi:transposase
MKGVKSMSQKKDFDLDSKIVGALPIVNHFLERMQVSTILGKHLSRPNSRIKISRSLSLEVLVRNLILCRKPLYSIGEWAQQMVPGLLGLKKQHAKLLNDDRIGRALDTLFDADRNVLLTDFVVHIIREFNVDLSQFHNDSTSITLHGNYKKGDGRLVRGKTTLKVTWGHNRDHRPDLKQLLWILTVSADGAVPVNFKVSDGNTQDSTTHIETWKILRRFVGDPHFLYVADSKLCTRENLKYIHEQGGHFITVLPRSRKEDGQFKEWIQNNTPDWKETARYPHPSQKNGPPNVISSIESPIPDSDGYRLIWFYSSHKKERDAENRRMAIDKALKELDELNTKLEGPRCRYRTRQGVAEAADTMLEEANAQSWIRYTINEWEEEHYRQEKRGRPGNKTRWRRSTKTRFSLSWNTIREKIEASACTDGIFPLITNCFEHSARQILEAYKSKQPFVETRHDLLKNTLEATPAFLKGVARLEAYLFVHYIAVTAHSLIERELRNAMKKGKIKELPFYPEERLCRAPTMSRICDIFAPVSRHILYKDGKEIQRFPPELSKLQKQILKLLGMSEQKYNASWQAFD